MRELEEELGLSVDSALMESAYVATIPSSVRGSTPKHGDFDCREFQDLYLLRLEDVGREHPKAAGLPAAKLRTAADCPAQRW